MKKTLLLAVLAVSVSAHAVTIVESEAEFKYINATAATTFGGSTTGWTEAGYDDSAWFDGQAIFGNTDSLAPRNTQWDVNYDPFLRKKINLATDMTNVVLSVAVDNGFTMYIDGAQVATANAGGFTSYWEYTFNLSDLSAGEHQLAIALDDYGGLTTFDMMLEGEAVPEPASMAALGLGAVALMRRRKKK